MFKKTIHLKYLLLFFIIGNLFSVFAQETKQNENTRAQNEKIEKLYFLIHGLCYQDMCKTTGTFSDEKLIPYLEREKKCTQQWRERLKGFSENEALVIVPWTTDKKGPVAEFNRFAKSILKDHCFILDTPGPFENEFWADSSCAFQLNIIDEIQAAFVYQKEAWNKEELITALHAKACAGQFCKMLKDRGFVFNAKTVQSEGWGASFDGCVLKYSLNFRRILNLEHAIEINFDLTVPDASFLLNAKMLSSFIRNDGLRIFVFENNNKLFALCTLTTFALDSAQRYIALNKGKIKAVKSKQGIQLWPQTQDYYLPNAPIGHYEPPQNPVSIKNDSLLVPATSGFVYRLVKAPAFIFASEKIEFSDFFNLLQKAELVEF